MCVHAPSPFQKHPQTPSQQRPSDLRDLRVNVVKQHVPVSYPLTETATLRKQSRAILLTLGRNHGGENFYIFITAAVNLMHRFRLLSPKVPGDGRPLSEPLVARSPNPIWLGDHCAVHKRQAGAVISFHSRVFTATFSNPICLFFFFFMNPIIANLWWSLVLQSPPSQDVFNIFILPCLLQWIWKSFVKWWWSEIAYSVSAKRGWRMILKRKRDFWYWQFPFSFQKWRAFFPPPLSRRTGYSVICHVLIWLPSKFLF